MPTKKNTTQPEPITMTNPIQGLVHVTGEPDTGKTTFALSTGFDPKDICFFDDDLKTQAIANMLKEQGTPFGAYFNLTQMSLGMREIEYHNLVVDLIENQCMGKNFKVLIFDTWTRFESTFHPIVQKNPQKFKEFYSPMGTIKGAEMWKASFDYETIFIDKLFKVAPLVILVTHLKEKMIGAAKTGAYIPDCKKPVIEKSRLRIWTRNNPQSPAPIGLVLKRLSKVEINHGIQTINVLPRKITPCTWEKILEYWENPIGNRAPLQDEMLNDFELSILDGVLTNDQKDILHINRMESDKPEEKQLPVSKIVTINDLVTQYGYERVMEANNGMPPTNGQVEEVRKKLESA